LRSAIRLEIKMNADVLAEIKQECEVVEQKGFGYVKILFKNGMIYLIETSFNRLVLNSVEKRLDKSS